MGKFSPGPLSASQAAALNAMFEEVDRFRRLTAAKPLSVSRQGGVPVVRIAPPYLAKDVILGEVVSSSGSPPVHVVKRKTRNAYNAVVDHDPLWEYLQVLSTDGAAISNGTLVELAAIPDMVDWWWAFPLAAAAAPGFFARLTTSGSNGSGYGTAWKYVVQAWYDVSGYGWHDVGSESADYVAFPLPVDGTNYANPVAGLRVWMEPSAHLAGCFEFEPYGYADDTHPGLVSTGTQTFKGNKTVDGTLEVVNSITGDTSGAFSTFISLNSEIVFYAGTQAFTISLPTALTGVTAYTPTVPTTGPGETIVSHAGINFTGKVFVTEVSYGSYNAAGVWIVPTPSITGQVQGLLINGGIYAIYDPLDGMVYPGLTTLINYLDHSSNPRTATFKGGILTDDASSGS